MYVCFSRTDAVGGPLFLCVGRLEELYANVVSPLGVIVVAPIVVREKQTNVFP